MSSESSSNKSSERKKKKPFCNRPVSRFLVLGVAVCLLMTGLLSLSGCNWWKHGGGLPASSHHSNDVVTVFFSKYQGNRSIVEEVVRKLPSGSQTEPLQFALTELLKGPTPEEKTQGFYSEIPQGTQLLNVEQVNDTVTVNLSKQFASGGGSNSMEQRFEELKQTVYSVDSGHKLNVAVEGKALELLGGEGLEVQDATKRDAQ
jgi:spore germination protein GerM